MRKSLLSLALISVSLCYGEEQELTINLKDPVFRGGVITTERGGVISSENMRIQAQKIEYTNRVENGQPVKKVVAEGDILMEHDGHAFVGKRLEYDFITKTGTLWDGRTSNDYWFLGGDEIEMQADGSYMITNAFVTTVEGGDNWWELRSGKIGVNKDSILSAKNIRFRFFKIPVFWLPSFKANLKWLKDSPVRYKFIWDQILKQKISMRYEIYSTETFSLFGRLDYRFKYGPGGAIETDYKSLNERTLFQTKTYGAFDKLVPDEKGTKRFRLQGLVTHRSGNEKTRLHLSYDRLSDDKMPQDFKSDDFELDTQKRTILWLTHQEKNSFSRFNLQPRINRFQSINQELPYIMTTVRPFTIGKSGIISENWFSAGYLNYVFGKVLNQKLHSTNAGRFATTNNIYRPFPWGPFTLTPNAGLLGIFYSNNQQHHSTGQWMMAYGFEGLTTVCRQYASFKHTVQPYLFFQGYSHPTSVTGEHFIFNIEDGLTRLNSLRGGIRQSFSANYFLDLFTYAFYGKTAFHRTVPKAYMTFEVHQPSYAIRTGFAYNMQQQLCDFANIRTDWTVSEDFAFGVEFRHRSKYDWRKADHENFMMDVQRPISELVHTPISDGRDTLLTRFQIRFSPLWTCHFESHHGWGRRDEPRYNEFELRFRTMLTGKWQLDFGVKFDPANRIEGIIPALKLVR